MATDPSRWVVGCEGTDEIIATLAPTPVGPSHAVRAATGLPACATEAELQIFYGADWHRSTLPERCAHCVRVVPPRMVEHNWDSWGPQVHQAAAMIVIQAGVDILAAFMLLIDHAKASGRTMEATALAVVQRTLRFDRD